MGPRRRLFSLALGALPVAVLLRFLPEPVFGATRAFLLVAASGILLATSAALFLLPARRLLARAFGLPLRLEGPAFGLPREDEMRTTLSPLVVAGVLLAIVLAASLLRA